jgi:hypothetical protein
VYPRYCPVLFQLEPGRAGYLQITHIVDELNPKMVLEMCDRCKRKEQKHSWLKDTLAKFPRPSWIKPSEHTPCEICQNYQVEEETAPPDLTFVSTINKGVTQWKRYS